jgi:hypothetical protein
MCACGKDKTEDPQPKQDEIFIVKGVTKTHTEEYVEGDVVFVYNQWSYTNKMQFTYKNEKLVSVNYTYSDIEGTETEIGEISDLYLAKHKFSEDNYVVRCNYPIEEEYDKEGYNTYTWSKGNLTEIKNYFYKYDPHEKEYEIKYSDIENKTNIDWAMFLFGSYGEYNFPYYYSKDYLLNISKNIPSYINAWLEYYFKDVEIDEQGRLVAFTMEANQHDGDRTVEKFIIEY